MDFHRFSLLFIAFHRFFIDFNRDDRRGPKSETINTRVATGGEGGGHPSKPTPRISIENVRGGYRREGLFY